MTRELTEILAFVRLHKVAVQSSNALEGAPQAAVIGFVASDTFELFFDTLGDTRKAANLRRDGRISLVVGWSLETARTVQLEGTADEPTGDDLARLKALYFERFPDGVERESWPGIAYFRVRPTWVRSSDFSGAKPVIVEWPA